MRKFPLSELLAIIKYPLLFIIVCWAIFLADNSFDLDLYRLGISPRTFHGSVGILFAPVIHGDLSHIANNTLPVFILSSMIFYFYRSIAWPAIIWIWLISCIWLWVGGRNNNVIPTFHFGASMLIYGFSTFLFFSGIFRKHKQLMVVSAIVVFMYGSISWGMFPFDKSMSWEGHLFGAISGVLVAYNYRKEGPQPQEYQWPEEEVDLEALDAEEPIEQDQTEETDEDKSTKDSHTGHSSINITYTYLPKKKEDDDKL